MATKVVQQRTVSAKLIGRWEQAGQKLVALAEVIPESKFDYKPAGDVRTFAEVLRHVAFWNRYVADSARGRKCDDTGNELPQDEFSTKPQIIRALKHSTAEAAGAFRESLSGLSLEMAEMLVTFIEHNCEHYGQLAVYARLIGIVPPTSRS